MSRFGFYIKQNRVHVIVLAAVFIAAVTLSLIISRPAFESCLWALALVITSGSAGILPILTPVLSIRRVILSIAARVLTIFIGAICILFLSKINVLFFVLWLAIFYLPMMFVEVLIMISPINKSKQI
jgi:hypothetical protein